MSRREERHAGPTGDVNESERIEAMNEVLTVLGNLGETTGSFFLYERLQADEDLDQKFQALEAISELERPQTVRALREILRIFKD